MERPRPGNASKHDGAAVIAVAVIEDHPVYRDGLCRVVADDPALSLVGGYPTLEDFLGDAAQPQLVLLDLHLPDRGAAAGVVLVRETGAQVLIVSASAARDDVLDAISAGAGGYLTKNAEPAEIVAATILVASGGSYISPTLAGYLVDTRRDLETPGAGLSNREREVLRLVAQGERDQDIAEQLFISVRTVRSHLDRIRDKTGQRRRADLTRFVIEHRMMAPRP